MARKKEISGCKKLLTTLITILLVLILGPIGLVFYFVFIVCWLVFTLTGIGPVLHALCDRKDREVTNLDHLIEKNSDLMRIPVPGHVHSCSKGKPYTVVARFTEPRLASSSESVSSEVLKRNRYPVCIPNGLGATMVTISILHEELVRRGFTVLSFDRMGVGFSDPNTSGTSPSAEDVVKEMHFIMKAVAPTAQWMIIGPSMGSIVGQCYAAEHPEDVVGFLNMDGLPYPFVHFKSRFEMAAQLYKIYPYIIWTGILRPFIALAFRNPKLRWVVSSAFNMDVVTAQINDARFFSNIGLEMITMMDCAGFASNAWGSMGILPVIKAAEGEGKESGGGGTSTEGDITAALQAKELLMVLAGAPPDESIEVDAMTVGKEQRLPTEFISESEVAEDWRDVEAVKDAMQKIQTYGDAAEKENVAAARVGSTETNELHKELLEGGTLISPTTGKLPDIWKQLVVRVMSGRSHDYGNALANSFYTDEMKDYAAIEHAMHALLAKNGSRTVYPHLSHMHMFAQRDEIVRYAIEINDSLVTEVV